MLQNIIQAEINMKKKRYTAGITKLKTAPQKINLHNSTIVDKSTSTENILMCDKSTSTEDLVKKEKERKILEKFKKQTKKKQEKADLFKQVLGSPRNVEEVEDE